MIKKQPKGEDALRIVLIGPPGSGKGTQGKILSASLGIPHLSTGDMLRAEIATGSDLGKRIKSFIDKGLFVTDDMINPIVVQRLACEDCNRGFILDGFPRNTAQAEYLTEQNIRINAAINLQMSDEDVTKRLLRRASCIDCGTVYQQNLKGTAVCPACGSQNFKRRADDNIEAITKRLEIYKSETAPTISYYKKQRVLICIDGKGCMRVVENRIKKAFVDRGLLSKSRFRE